MRSFPFVLLACAALAAQDSRPPEPAVYDLVIRGGQVLDGTGAPALAADVGVHRDRIVRIGDLGAARAVEIIDARGKVVAPGFIDVHVHVDYEILRHPDAPNFLAMGVTTILSGNCGSSVEKIGDHLDALKKQGVSINYGTLVGHGTVRALVMQNARRAPKTAELVKMEDLVAHGMMEGAFGLATGLIYVPGTYAKTPELVALARVVAAHRGVYASHVRDEGLEIDAAIDEVLTIAKEAAVPVHVSHVKSSGKASWGRAAHVVRRLEEARAKGLRITADQYAYDASSTGLDILFDADLLEGGRRAFGDKLAGDAAFRAKVEAAVLAAARKNGFEDLSYAAVARAPDQPELNGLTMADAAERLFGSKTAADQARAATELMIRAKGAKVAMVYHGLCDDDVRTFLKVPWIAIASDSGVKTDAPSRPHPRGFGNNPRVLGHYVRAGVLPLAEAVAKMTSRPAATFGIKERGIVREGWFADLVVFDPATIADRATYADPFAEPAGIAKVIVNGTVVVDDGRHTKLRSGAVLRHVRDR